MNKTLIGKNDYLFLINDNCRELEVHCENLNLVKDENLLRYNINNFFMVVYPNKSLIHKKYLPDNYVIKYRPAIDIYTKKLNDKILDCYDILKDHEDTYYKTDTHINLKGNKIIYDNFIEKINNVFGMDVKKINFTLKSKNVELCTVNRGIGDLTWGMNLGNQVLTDKNDTYFYTEDIEELYCNYVIKKENFIRLVNFNLEDVTDFYDNTILSWNTVSNNIIYKKTLLETDKIIVIFYDSFLLNAINIYLETFTTNGYNVYLIIVKKHKKCTNFFINKK